MQKEQPGNLDTKLPQAPAKHDVVATGAVRGMMRPDPPFVPTPLETLQPFQRGLGTVDDQLSPDGKWVAVAGGGRNEVAVWDAATGGKAVGSMTAGRGFSRAVAFSPDSRLVAVVGEGERLYVWDHANKMCVHDLELPSAGGWSVAFSPDGKRIAAGCDSGKQRVWEADTGKVVSTAALTEKPIRSLKFHPDGKQILSGGDDGLVRVWSAAGGTQATEWPMPDGTRGISQFHGVIRLAVDPTGKRVAAVTRSLSKRFERFRTRDGGGETVEFYDSADCTHLLDAVTGRPVCKPLPYGGPLAFTPDGARLIAARTGVADVDSRIHALDPNTGEWDGREVIAHRGEKCGVAALSLTTDGTRLATSSAKGEIKLWSLEPGSKPVRYLTGQAHADPVDTVRVSPGGRFVATASGSRWAIWDAKTLREQVNLEAEWLRLLVFTADDKSFVTVSSWQSGDDAVGTVRESVTGRTLATQKLGRDRDFHLVHVDAANTMTPLRGGDFTADRAATAVAVAGNWSPVEGVQFSRDRRYKSALEHREVKGSYSKSGLITVIDTTTGKVVGRVERLPADKWAGADIYGYTLSADGTLVVVTDAGGLKDAFDVYRATGERVATIRLSERMTAVSRSRLATSRAGDRLALIHYDTHFNQDAGVSVWDLATGKLVRFREYPERDYGVLTCVEFTADGSAVLAGTRAGTVLRLDLSGK